MTFSDPYQIIYDVGRRVAEIRSLRRLTQENLAALADVTLKYLQRIEAGKENLTLESLVHLANLLDVDPSEFFTKPSNYSRKRGRPPRIRIPEA